MKILLCITLLLTSFTLRSQDVIIEGNILPKSQEYYTKFNSFEIFEIDVEKVRRSFAATKRTSVEAELKLGNRSYILQLFKYNILDPKAKVKCMTANGLEERDQSPGLETYRGNNANFGGGEVALTFAPNFMSLMFKQGDQTFYLEQFRYEFKDQNPNRFILYTQNSIKQSTSIVTTAEHAEELHEKHEHQDHDTTKIIPRNFICWEIDIAMGADFTFFASYGKDRATTDGRLLAIVNLMQTDWLYPKMIADYYWNISGIFVSEDSIRDPFVNSNSINSHLGIFSNIAFSVFPGFDIATLWTSKFFRAPQYAVAGDPRACLFSPFTVCSEFVKDNSVVRQLQSHVAGHCFTAQHDGGGSPTIMNPSMSGFNIWSLPSQFAIYEWAWNIKGCLVDCSGGYIPIAEFSATPTDGCVPLVVQYNNMSTNGTMYKWKFPGGTPASSTDKDPIIIYNSVGSFSVELEVINSKCSTKIEKLDYIIPRDKPRFVDFQFGAANLGNDIEFFGFGDRVDEWKWKFHDGTRDEGQVVTKTYPKEGEFEVELCVKNDCGETCIKKKVSNFYKPIADFTSDTTAGCAPSTIKFFDMSTVNVINWTWSFPGGTPTGSFVKNPIVKYSRPGIYKVKLVVNSAKNNDSKEKEMYITIDSLPLAQFDPVTNVSTVKFNNTSLYGKTYSWDFGDGTSSTDQNPEHVYRDGRYDVILSVKNACGTTTTKRTVTIGAKPIAGFSVTNSNGCVPYTVKFQNNSTATAQTFEWFFPGGNPSTSTDKEPTITYSTIGNYDVKLIARAGVESDSITQVSFIKVEEGPTSEFINSVTGFEAFFTDNSKKANKYFWEFGDGKTSTESSPKHNYGVEGEFKVRLITENDCGVDTIEKIVAVYLIPKVNFTSDVIKGCAPFTVNFLDRSSVDVIEWSWQFESGTPLTSAQKNPSVKFNKAGRYTVKLSVRNGNGTNSATKLRYVEVISPIKCPKLPPKKKGTDIVSQELINEELLKERLNTHTVSIYPNPAKNQLHVESAPGTN
ncbi:MAG: PKD domain-containing protein, partial [Saprospiraceae bacterium]|nr:PKD domain-containing protein [Saprospiraceae bacterium]